MKSDIVLAGVGGQGILSIAASIGMAAIRNGLYLKQAEVHGMSQRGGAVQSHLRVSSKPISSDLIPKGSADIILSVEPMESLRYLYYLAPGGWLVTNLNPMVNIPAYPDIDTIKEEIKKVKNNIILDADRMAADMRSKRSSNMIMLGAATPFIDIPFEDFEQGVITIFKGKSKEMIEINIKALRQGRQLADNYLL